MSDIVWVITGANSGFGLAIALHVLSKGHKVVATVRSLSKFPEALKNAGAQPVVADFSASDEEMQKSAHDALKVYGHVEVLVNNAGMGVFGPVEESDMQQIRSQFQVNVFAQIAFTQPFITHFRARRTGHILNFSSTASTNVYPSWCAYSASKAALDAFTDALHHELALYNVRVLSIVPGFFATDFIGKVANAQETVSDERTVHTHPSQGYKGFNNLAKLRHLEKHVGDPEKLAARVYEIVAGTGLAQGLALGQGGKFEWNRVILGSDCGENVLQRLDALVENVKAFEPLWRSTDMDAAQLEAFGASIEAQ